MIKKITGIKYLDNFLLGILAGIAIGVGGLLNLFMLSFGLKITGGILFSVGLLTVCFLGLHLYTGKIGYITENPKSFGLSLLIMYIGNIVGAVGFGYLMRLTGLSTTGMLKDIASTVANNKIINTGSGVGQASAKMILNGFLCGIMVFLAVDIFKKAKKIPIKVIGIIVCVAIFVVLGFEHCVADMFYFAIGDSYSSNLFPSILAIVLSTVGNTLGGMLAYYLVKQFCPKNLI